MVVSRFGVSYCCCSRYYGNSQDLHWEDGNVVRAFFLFLFLSSKNHLDKQKIINGNGTKNTLSNCLFSDVCRFCGSQLLPYGRQYSSFNVGNPAMVLMDCNRRTVHTHILWDKNDYGQF